MVFSELVFPFRINSQSDPGNVPSLGDDSYVDEDELEVRGSHEPDKQEVRGSPESDEVLDIGRERGGVTPIDTSQFASEAEVGVVASSENLG